MADKLATACILGGIALAAVTLVSPTIESSMDTFVAETAITNTCYEQHNFNFLLRWACRSSYRQAGLAGLSAKCAFERTSAYCRNFWAVRRDAE